MSPTPPSAARALTGAGFRSVQPAPDEPAALANEATRHHLPRAWGAHFLRALRMFAHLL
jgi:hypothetical protein